MMCQCMFTLGNIFLTSCLFSLYFRLPCNHIDKILIDTNFLDCGREQIQAHFESFPPTHKEIYLQNDRSVW